MVYRGPSRCSRTARRSARFALKERRISDTETTSTSTRAPSPTKSVRSHVTPRIEALSPLLNAAHWSFIHGRTFCFHRKATANRPKIHAATIPNSRSCSVCAIDPPYTLVHRSARFTRVFLDAHPHSLNGEQHVVVTPPPVQLRGVVVLDGLAGDLETVGALQHLSNSDPAVQGPCGPVTIDVAAHDHLPPRQ